MHLALKWVGAAYLLFLGWQLLRAKGPGAGNAGKPITFAEAAAFQFLNPKAWIISLTAATLFLPPQVGQILASGYVATIITLVNPLHHGVGPVRQLPWRGADAADSTPHLQLGDGGGTGGHRCHDGRVRPHPGTPCVQ